MKKFSRLLIFLAVFCYQPVHAQSKSITITGRVISFEESFGLEGVSINIKGSSVYSGTHADGTFSLSMDSVEKILVFSLQDYQTTELKINENSQDYQVILRRSDNIDSNDKNTNEAILHTQPPAGAVKELVCCIQTKPGTYD